MMRPIKSPLAPPTCQHCCQSKNCPGNREVAPGEEEEIDRGQAPGNTVLDGAPGASCSVGQALPLGWSQLDELAPQRLELGGSVVILDVLRVVRDGVDQPVP